MALFVKVRHQFGHRWMPFFVPVVASLLYVLLVVLLVPERFSSKAKGDSDGDDAHGAPAASAGKLDDAAKGGARRRPRVGVRPAVPAGAAAPPGVAPGAPPGGPAPAAPASPDGAD